MDNHIRIMDSKNYTIEDVIPVKQTVSTYLAYLFILLMLRLQIIIIMNLL